MLEESQAQRSKLREYASKMAAFKNGLYDAVQAIQNPRQLKSIMIKLFNEQVKLTGSRKVDTGADLKVEYGLQKGYLLKNAKSLKERFIKEHGTHKTDCSKMMQENVELIEQISVLREKMKQLAPVRRQAELLPNKSAPNIKGNNSHATEIKTQREQIRSLRQRVAKLEEPQKRPATRGLYPIGHDITS